jgi:hypothetical protein
MGSAEKPRCLKGWGTRLHLGGIEFCKSPEDTLRQFAHPSMINHSGCGGHTCNPSASKAKGHQDPVSKANKQINKKSRSQGGKRTSSTRHGTMQSSQLTSHSKGKDWKVPLRPGTKQGHLLSPLFNTVWEVPDRAIGQEKERKGMQTGTGKVKLPSYSGDMTS